MSIFGGILSAVAGPIIGGIFNKKAAKDAHASSVQDTLLQLPRLRQSAEDAGFNPLTALLVNGGGSFNAGGQAAAPLASTAVLTNAVQGVSDVLTGDAEVRRATDKANLELAQVELERLKSGGASSAVAATQKARLPAMGKIQPRRELVPTSAAKAIPKQLGVSTIGSTMVTNPNPAQSNTFVDPRRPDAEHSEQRYGDIMQEVAGFGNLAADSEFTARVWEIQKDYGRDVADRAIEYLRQHPMAEIDEAVSQTKLGRLKRITPKIGPMQVEMLPPYYTQN